MSSQSDVERELSRLKKEIAPGAADPADRAGAGVGRRRDGPARGVCVTRTAAGVVLVAAAVVSAGVLSVEDASSGSGFLSGGTLYPAAAWVFALALGVAGVALVVGAGPAVAGVGGVASLQLAGTGLVAVKHWRPYMGMAGTYEHLAVLQLLAGLLALAAFVAVVVCLAVLVGARAFPVPARPLVVWSSVVVGGVLLATVPVLVGRGDPETMDVSSLGAFALVYGVPWGLSVAASAWMVQRTAVAVLAAVLGSTLLAAATKPMVDIVFTSPTSAFVSASAAVVVVLAVRGLLGSERRGRRCCVRSRPARLRTGRRGWRARRVHACSSPLRRHSRRPRPRCRTTAVPAGARAGEPSRTVLRRPAPGSSGC